MLSLASSKSNWILPLYSIVTYMAALKTIDFIVEGLDRDKTAIIVTSKEQEICNALSEEFGTGITLINAKGYYSNEEKDDGLSGSQSISDWKDERYHSRFR